MEKRINSVKKQTDNKFLNMYELDYTHRDGKTSAYFMASRLPDTDSIKLFSEEKRADAVMVYAVLEDGRIVLERQYRPVIDDYIYEFPAGLCEAGESYEEAAVREFYEETGLSLELISGHDSSRPYYTSVGVSDESIATVYGHAAGEPSTENQEDTEDIQVIFADRAECMRILKEENVTIMCAFLLMSYIRSTDNPFDFMI